jgi:hypothetical protein
MEEVWASRVRWSGVRLFYLIFLSMRGHSRIRQRFQQIEFGRTAKSWIGLTNQMSMAADRYVLYPRSLLSVYDN